MLKMLRKIIYFCAKVVSVQENGIGSGYGVRKGVLELPSRKSVQCLEM
jgi:hypothetical protein